VKILELFPCAFEFFFLGGGGGGGGGLDFAEAILMSVIANV
jgi:hypothetical protein